MAKKLGDLIIALIILSFIITGFSLFINDAESSESISTGVLSSSFTSFGSNLSQVKSLEHDIAQKVDNTSNLQPSENIDVETQGDDAGGLINLLSKNILTKFFISAGQNIPGSSLIFGLLASIVSVIIFILFLRFFRGETKI